MDWKDVQALRKQGKFSDGKRLAYELLEGDASDFRTRSMLEWLIYDDVKPSFRAAIDAVRAEKVPTQADLRCIDDALTEFARLPAQRPGMACSVLLQQLCRIAPEYPRFAAFVKWVGLEGLREQDWNAQPSADGNWPPLVTSVARALAKWAKKRNPPLARLEEVLQWLEAATPVSSGEDGLWLQWDLAGILRRLARPEEAAKALSTVIRAKRNEFWVWAEAARLYAPDDSDLALACFCQALLCSSSSEFVAKVHRELAELLAERGDYLQASAEVRIACAIREDQGWRVGAELEALMRAHWFEPEASGARDPRHYYLEHAPFALGLCFDTVETRAATFLGTLTLPPPADAKPGWISRPRVRFAVMSDESSSTSLLGPHLRKPRWAPGDAVSLIIGERTGSAKGTILQIVDREGGRCWDCTMPRHGVVTREASGERVMRVFCGRDLGEVRVDDLSRSREKMTAGTGVTFNLVVNPANGRGEAFAVMPAPLPGTDVKRVRGRLKRVDAKGYGFVDDIFVPPHLLGAISESADEVDVIAVYVPHPSKGHGWLAVRVEVTGTRG